jgi:hypothetical protein
MVQVQSSLGSSHSPGPLHVKPCTLGHVEGLLHSMLSMHIVFALLPLTLPTPLPPTPHHHTHAPTPPQPCARRRRAP